MLDSVFDDGLQGERRQAKEGVRRVVIDQEAVIKLGLLHGEVGARVLQFFGEGDQLLARDGGEVFAEVGGEIHRDLLGQIGVLFAEIVDACHGIVDEVRPHLQHHDAGALMGDLSLLAQILLDLIRQDDAEHRKRADDDADGEQLKYRDKEMDEHGGHDREQSDEEGEKASSGQPVPPADATLPS